MADSKMTGKKTLLCLLATFLFVLQDGVECATRRKPPSRIIHRPGKNPLRCYNENGQSRCVEIKKDEVGKEKVKQKDEHDIETGPLGGKLYKIGDGMMECFPNGQCFDVHEVTTPEPEPEPPAGIFYRRGNTIFECFPNGECTAVDVVEPENEGEEEEGEEYDDEGGDNGIGNNGAGNGNNGAGNGNNGAGNGNNGAANGNNGGGNGNNAVGNGNNGVGNGNNGVGNGNNGAGNGNNGVGNGNNGAGNGNNGIGDGSSGLGNGNNEIVGGIGNGNNGLGDGSSGLGNGNNEIVGGLGNGNDGLVGGNNGLGGGNMGLSDSNNGLGGGNNGQGGDNNGLGGGNNGLGGDGSGLGGGNNGLIGGNGLGGGNNGLGDSNNGNIGLSDGNNGLEGGNHGLGGPVLTETAPVQSPVPDGGRPDGKAVCQFQNSAHVQGGIILLEDHTQTLMQVIGKLEGLKEGIHVLTFHTEGDTDTPGCRGVGPYYRPSPSVRKRSVPGFEPPPSHREKREIELFRMGEMYIEESYLTCQRHVESCKQHQLAASVCDTYITRCVPILKCKKCKEKYPETTSFDTIQDLEDSGQFTFRSHLPRNSLILYANEEGDANFKESEREQTITGPQSVIGRSIVLSQLPKGADGDFRGIACCRIEEGGPNIVA